jgi:hypothetical protein
VLDEKFIESDFISLSNQRIQLTNLKKGKPKLYANLPDSSAFQEREKKD